MDPLSNMFQRLAALSAGQGKDALVAAHNREYKNMMKNFYGAPDSLVVHTTCPGQAKPAAKASQPRPFGQLSPIDVRGLRPGTTHRGRVLRGKLIVDPFIMTSICTLLEDEKGDVVRVRMPPAQLYTLVHMKSTPRTVHLCALPQRCVPYTWQMAPAYHVPPPATCYPPSHTLSSLLPFRIKTSACTHPQLFVYNMLPSNLSDLAAMRAAAVALPNGAEVAIIDPFFKMCADGGMGVRVDDPTEVRHAACRAGMRAGLWVGPRAALVRVGPAWTGAQRGGQAQSVKVRWRAQRVGRASGRLMQCIRGCGCGRMCLKALQELNVMRNAYAA